MFKPRRTDAAVELPSPWFFLRKESLNDAFTGLPSLKMRVQAGGSSALYGLCLCLCDRLIGKAEAGDCKSKIVDMICAMGLLCLRVRMRWYGCLHYITLHGLLLLLLLVTRAMHLVRFVFLLRHSCTFLCKEQVANAGFVWGS